MANLIILTVLFLLGSINTVSAQDTFVISMVYVQENTVVSCIDITADIDPALLSSFRSGVVQGAIKNGGAGMKYYTRPCDAGLKFVQPLKAEHCTFSINVDGIETRYNAHYYVRAGRVWRNTCNEYHGSYSRS